LEAGAGKRGERPNTMTEAFAVECEEMVEASGRIP